MSDEFSRSVQLGLKLAERIYYGKDRRPPPQVFMERKSSETTTYSPTAPMVYAVITEPAIVDNPDIPSYQPYVHGRCEPPALIPLHMHAITMEVDCYLDTAFITVSGQWRLHCVTASRSCDCRIAVPMGEEGSILGVEVECPTRLYSTELISSEDTKDAEKAKDGLLLKRQIYTLKIPRVGGGSTLSVKVCWSQKLLYRENQFCLVIPFSFQPYVIPVARKVSKKEKIELNINSGVELEILCKSASHPLKQVRRQAGKLGFSYERDVRTWSMNDFSFSYSVTSSDISGNILLQSPPLDDFDQKDIFCLYLCPGNSNSRMEFKKEVVFVVDVSASMRGAPIENAKVALVASLSKLNPVDTFNIIAFSGNSLLFSSTMELATKEAIQIAIQWINSNFIADGGTNISWPLNQALKMTSKAADSISLIFLITDGTVEDERDICDAIKSQLMEGDLSSPRISTFGIGSYCNHYFLQTLAHIGRGYYDAAYDSDSICIRMERLFNQASSVILADISIDSLEHLDSLELYPFRLRDLSSGSLCIISGRYTGKSADSVKIRGTLADLGNFVINAKVQKAKDIPMERVFAKRQIDSLTANAWLSGSKEIERKAGNISLPGKHVALESSEVVIFSQPGLTFSLASKIAKMSLRTGVPSGFTDIILVETNKEQASKQKNAQVMAAEKSDKKITILQSLGLGYGSLKATTNNLPPETAEPVLHETSEMILKAATDWCSRTLDCCCCMCFVQFCSRLNDQCAIVFTQLCTALACFECISFCVEVCECCGICDC